MHSVPARALDEAIWNDVVNFLADPERGMAAARQLALEAENHLAEIADKRNRIVQRLAALDQEADGAVAPIRQSLVAKIRGGRG